MSGEQLFADTNRFLRFLTNDIPEQANAFEGLLKEVATFDRKHFTRFEGINLRLPQ